MADRLRDPETVRRLYSQLRQRIHDDYKVDINTWNVAWKHLACERLATYGPSVEAALIAAEGDCVVAMGLVKLIGLTQAAQQTASSLPSLLNERLLVRWHDYAREQSSHHPDIDPLTWHVLTVIGYGVLRQESKS